MAMNNSLTRRSFLAGAAAVAATAGLAACGGSASSSSAAGSAAGSAAAGSSASDNQNEVTEVKWARANSGNIFVTLAQEKGYFEEYGLKVTEEPISGGAADFFSALSSEQVDVTSNNGTMALPEIAKGVDLTIVGGYMLQGMYLIAPKGTKWNGIQDVVGKKIAHSQPQIPVCYALDQAGFDPATSVEWFQVSTGADRLAAVVAGEADYGYMPGDMMYTVKNSNDVDIVCYADELMPAYGCCRMNMRTQFVNDNPNTVKSIMKAMVRANQYFHANLDECVTILAQQLNTDEEYVAAYLKDPHYIPDTDPVKNNVVNSWDIYQKVGLINPDDAAKIKIEDHIREDIYKAALDEVIAEHKDDDPEWYEGRLEFFQKYNA